MEVYRYAEVILRRWWLIPLFLLVGVGSALFYSRGQTPLYQSTVTLALNPAVPSELVPYISSSSSGQTVERLAGSYAELLKSRLIDALRVLSEMRLYNHRNEAPGPDLQLPRPGEGLGCRLSFPLVQVSELLEARAESPTFLGACRTPRERRQPQPK